MSDIEKKSLYAISHELVAIENLIIDQDGFITEDQELKLTNALALSKEKVTNYCVYLDHIKSKREFVAQQVKKANEYIASLDKLNDKLEAMAMRALEHSTEGKLEGFNGHFLATRKSKSVEITDADRLPLIMTRTVTKIEPDKIAIKKELDAGNEVTGAKLVEKLHFRYK